MFLVHDRHFTSKTTSPAKRLLGALRRTEGPSEKDLALACAARPGPPRSAGRGVLGAAPVAHKASASVVPTAVVPEKTLPLGNKVALKQHGGGGVIPASEALLPPRPVLRRRSESTRARSWAGSVSFVSGSANFEWKSFSFFNTILELLR